VASLASGTAACHKTARPLEIFQMFVEIPQRTRAKVPTMLLRVCVFTVLCSGAVGESLRGASKTDSIFAPSIFAPYDCSKLAPCSTDLETTEKCFKFYPKRFWQSSIAEPYADELKYQRFSRGGTFYENELILLRRNQQNHTTSPADQECVKKLPESLAYFHNFKAGGTTALNKLGFNPVPHYDTEKLIFAYNTEKFGTGAEFSKHAFDTSLEIYMRQQQTNATAIAFTFTRPPVEKFLSGIAQIDRMSIKWETTDESLPCFSIQNHVAKIECIADVIHGTGYFFNVHLLPQTYLFDTWTNGGLVDTELILLDLRDMNHILGEITGTDKVHVMRQSKNGEQVEVSELPPRVIHKICKLYEVDLVVFHMLGKPDPLCDPYVNKMTKHQASPRW
jgi:hypothetical protein